VGRGTDDDFLRAFVGAEVVTKKERKKERKKEKRDLGYCETEERKEKKKEKERKKMAGAEEFPDALSGFVCGLAQPKAGSLRLFIRRLSHRRRRSGAEMPDMTPPL